MIRSNTQKHRFAAAILAVTTAVIAASPSALAGKIANLSSGAWTGGAFTNAHTGAFSHCAVNAKYRSGVALYFAVSGARQWSMAFSARHWRFESGQTYAVHYQVDDGPVIHASAIAKGPGLMQVHLPVNGRSFSRFQHGTTLKVASGRKVMRFALTGAGPMLTKLVRCANHHAGAAENGPRSSSRKAPVARTGARLINVSFH